MAPPRQRERERPNAQHQQQTPTDTNHSYAEEGQVRSPRMGPSRRRANNVAHEHGVGQTESALRRSQAAEVDEDGDENGNANGVEIKPEEPVSVGKVWRAFCAGCRLTNGTLSRCLG